MSHAIATVVVLALILQALQKDFFRRLVSMAVATVLVTGLVILSEGEMLGRVAQSLPWRTLFMIGCLSLHTRILGVSGAFHSLAILVLRTTRGHGAWTGLVFAVGMYLLSGLMNNLATMLIMLPIVIEVLRRLQAGRHYSLALLTLLLPMCNLGGASTPVGDFPALILFSTGVIDFWDYLLPAYTVCAALSVVLLGCFYAFHWKVLSREAPSAEHVSQAVDELRREAPAVSTRRSKLQLLAQALVLLGMAAAWTAGGDPLTVALFGFACSLLVFVLSGLAPQALPCVEIPFLTRMLQAPRDARTMHTTRLEASATALLDAATVFCFFLLLFAMIGAVQETGLIARLADEFIAREAGTASSLLVFLFVVSIITALFSAGPGMAIALPLSATLIANSGFQSSPLYVAVALAVCAGSCLTLFSATSGPLLQIGVAQAGCNGRHTVNEQPPPA